MFIEFDGFDRLDLETPWTSLMGWTDLVHIALELDHQQAWVFLRL